MTECDGLRAELALARNEVMALQQLLEAHEMTLTQESKRLEDALALLTQEQRSLYARIEQDAEYDSLTGLPNRAAFGTRLEHSLDSISSNPDYKFAVLSINLDRFQMINESMGHLAGNQLLQGIADRLLSILRTTDMVSRPGTDMVSRPGTDMVSRPGTDMPGQRTIDIASRVDSEPTLARLGGDEFAVLLDDIQAVVNATQICDRIQGSLAAPFHIEGGDVFITASIGIALSTAAYQSSEEILRDAGMAMRRAKVLGKARSQLFDSEMRASAMVRWELETDLRHALERNELRVYYQSKVDLSKAKVVGFEALLRWEHPKRGLISPLQFIPIAEETGLIVQIGNWVLREACRQIREWNEQFRCEPPLCISVNLSCCQFADASLFDQIADALRDTQMDPQYLSLEITESNLMGNTEFAIEVLNKLKAMGVGLMIDDFGTGYSSLNYLARFPFDTLKIDQSFVRVMEKEVDGAEIVKTMLALAGNLGMDVVAEGIETNGQMKQLEALKCEYGQGYLFSKPLPVQATEKMLATIADGKTPGAVLAA